MLGDIGSGKTALVSRLRGGDDNPRRGHGLEYHCLEVSAADTSGAGSVGGVGGVSIEGDTRLGVWVLDGDPRHQNLLRFALPKAAYQHTLAVLVGSAEAPWALLDSLQQWADILNRHVDRLGLDPDEVKEARESLVRQFVDYAEPEVEGVDGAGNATSPVAAPTPPQPLVVDAGHLRRPGAAAANPLHPPADPDKYLLHRVYGLPCQQPAYVLERDCVFVPAGWDSPAKAALLLAGGPAAALAQSPYHEVLPKPSGSGAAANLAGAAAATSGQRRGGGVGGGASADEAEQLAEDEQVFLCRLQACLFKAAPAGGGAGAGGGGQRGGAGVPGAGGGPGGASAAAAAMGANDGVLATFFNSLLTKKGPGGQGGPGGGGPSGAETANKQAPAAAAPPSATQQS
uniref:Dynein light intermediate chain n=1 Tax=Macrostomum lignano TaxID=282301 RepID=A0A1I8IUS4_9PLAT